MKFHLDEIIIATAERIVIDYANLSGRESAHRAEFRNRVVEHLCTSLISLLEKYGEEVIGEEETEVNQIARDERLGVQTYYVITANMKRRNQLRAEQRTKLKEIISEIQK